MVGTPNSLIHHLITSNMSVLETLMCEGNLEEKGHGVGARECNLKPQER